MWFRIGKRIDLFFFYLSLVLFWFLDGGGLKGVRESILVGLSLKLKGDGIINKVIVRFF